MRRHTQLWLSSIAVAALMASAGAQTLGRDRKRRRRRRRPARNRTGRVGVGSFDRDNRRNQQQHGCGYVPDIDL
jgi:hypothetical protein